MKIFDIHPHVVSRDHDRYPFNNVFGHVAPYVTERPIDTEQMLVEMDAAGVTKSALVHSSTAYGYDNSYAADSAAAHPDRFASVCSIDVRAADAAERLRYWILERKMNGLRIFTAGGTMAENSDWLVDPETFPAWETASELGIPVCLQMKAGGFRVLPTLLERYPKIRIILDHVSHPKASDGPPYHLADPLWALKGTKNVYLKERGREHHAGLPRQVHRDVRHRSHRLGLELPRVGRSALQVGRAGEARTFVSLAERSGADLQRHRAVAVSDLGVRR